MYWNVHVDGLEYTHDLIVEREGVFKECVEAIKMAKILGYQVATNTTVYKETEVKEIERDVRIFLLARSRRAHHFSRLRIRCRQEGHGQAPRQTARGFFPHAGHDPEKFAKIQEWGERFTIFGTPVYQEFLAGKRELTCTAWAIPTRNIKGWKAPCYLMTDGHYAGYQEMLEKVDWNKYGVVDGVARDPRCENCMVHCGYDPSGALGTNYQSGDNWKNFRYNFAPSPSRIYGGAKVKAFNGVSIGKGHLAEAKAAINVRAQRSCATPTREDRTRGGSWRHQRTRRADGQD